MSKRVKIIKIMRNICFILFAIATVLLCGYLLKIEQEDSVSDSVYKEAEKEVKTEKGKGNTSPVDVLKSLKEQNEDTFGWIKIEDTKINYVVMYTPQDKEFYLHRDFYKNYSLAGTVFVDGRCDKDSDNLLIHGHNMNVGTMFHDLKKYEDKEFYDNHREITFNTLDGEGTYKVVAVFPATASSKYKGYKYYNYVGGTEAEFNSYVAYIKAASIYDFDEEVNYGDKLITLSTCSYHVKNGRFAVVAKKVN